jgi:hypothetical protein
MISRINHNVPVTDISWSGKDAGNRMPVRTGRESWPRLTLRVTVIAVLRYKSQHHNNEFID